MRFDVLRNRPAERRVASQRFEFRQLLLELETHVGLVRRVRAHDACRDVPVRVEGYAVNLCQQCAHLKIDVSQGQCRQRGRYGGQGLAIERCHQHVVLGQELFGIVRPQDGWRRKSFDWLEETIDIHLLFHLPVEGIRVDFEDDGLVRLCTAYLIDRADVSTAAQLESVDDPRWAISSYDRLCKGSRQVHVSAGQAISPTTRTRTRSEFPGKYASGRSSTSTVVNVRASAPAPVA